MKMTLYCQNSVGCVGKVVGVEVEVVLVVLVVVFRFLIMLMVFGVLVLVLLLEFVVLQSQENNPGFL